MADIQPVDGEQPANIQGPVSSDPTTAAAAASTNAQQDQLNASTPIRSLADLKEKAPKLYWMMMQGIAMNICNDMQRAQEHLKRIMREAQRDANS